MKQSPSQSSICFVPQKLNKKRGRLKVMQNNRQIIVFYQNFISKKLIKRTLCKSQTNNHHTHSTMFFDICKNDKSPDIAFEIGFLAYMLYAVLTTKIENHNASQYIVLFLKVTCCCILCGFFTFVLGAFVCSIGEKFVDFALRAIAVVCLGLFLRFV